MAAFFLTHCGEKSPGPAYYDPNRGCVQKNAKGSFVRSRNVNTFGECGAITSQNFSYQSLQGRNLKGLLATHCVFDQANLEGADLTGVEFVESSFDGASFRNAEMRDAVVRRSSFRKTDLSGASLSGNWSATNTWSGAQFDAETLLPFSLSMATQKGLQFTTLGQVGDALEARLGQKHVILSTHLTPETRALVQYTIQALQRPQQTTEIPRWFKTAFGGESVEDVARFTSDGIKFILAPTQSDPNIVASSPSYNWLNYMKNPGSTIPVAVINNQVVRLNDLQAGVIELGFGFTSFSNPSVDLQGTLLHERAHWVCSPHISIEDPQCLKRHAPCPYAQPFIKYGLAGGPFCDNIPWGAYAIEGLYASWRAHCAHCSEREKNRALVVSQHSYDRVLILEQMLRGDWGPPDFQTRGP